MLQSIDSSAPALAGFDYTAMPKDVAARQRARATKIAGIYRTTVEAAGEIGRELLAAQSELEHGLFLRWVEGANGLSKSTAYRFMDIARTLSDKLPTVGSLPMTVIHKLASPAMPAPDREEIVSRLEAGEVVSAMEISERLWKAQQQAKREAAEAKLTPEERKRRARAKRDAETRRQREHERWRAETAANDAKRKARAAELAAILVPLLDDAAYERVQELVQSVNGYDLRTALSEARRAAAPING